MDKIIKADFMPWQVKSMRILDDYRLFLTFADGKTGIYDAKPLLKYKVYERLKSPDFFRKAGLVGGTVVWNDDIDIAPELLYECSVFEKEDAQ